MPLIEKQAEVKLTSSTGEEQTGTIHFTLWPDGERRVRARRSTLKIVGSILAVCSLGLFVHILLIIFVPTAILTLLAAFPIYLKFLGDKTTFLHVDGKCPHCSFQGQLRPFLEKRLAQEVTLQCPECGQTTQARLAEAVETLTTD